MYYVSEEAASWFCAINLSSLFFFSFPSCFLPHVTTYSSEQEERIEVNFSTHVFMMDLQEDEENSDPVWVYPEDDEAEWLEGIEITEDESLTHNPLEDIILMPSNFDSKKSSIQGPHSFTAYK